MMREKENLAASEQKKAAFNCQRDTRLLRDDELEAVSGGAIWSGATATEYGAAVANPTWKP
jgi:hypothetical protein